MPNIKDFKYKLIPNFLTLEEIKLLNDYCRIKHRINFNSFDHQQNDNGDTFFYGDPLMESLMVNKLNLMQKETGLELLCTYAFWRMYTINADLKKHKDRATCEISTTLNLGGDLWPIFIEKNPNKGSYNEKNVYIPSNAKGTKVNLNPGDMLIYKGYELEHWRERFNKKVCGQVFLHYNDVNNKEAINNKFDSRPHLGLPTFFSKKWILNLLINI